MSLYSIQGIPKGRKASPLKILIYGDNGVGKSTFASHAPNPVFLDLEGNIDHLDVPKQPLSRYTEVMAFLDFLLTEPPTFKVLVVDSIDALEQQIWVAVCRQHNAHSICDRKIFSFGNGYTFASDYWKAFLEKLELLRTQKGMSIILIGHSSVRKCEHPLVENFDRFELRVQARAAGQVCDWCHCILFAAAELFIKSEEVGFGKTTKKGGTTGRRLLYTTTNAACVAKNIFDLPEKIPLEWSCFAREVRKFFKP